MGKKTFVKRKFVKVVSEAKVVDGKTVTTTKTEEWSDSPKETKFNWKLFEKIIKNVEKLCEETEK